MTKRGCVALATSSGGGVAPTLGTACPSLPPGGANPALGRPGGGGVAPALAAARAVLMHSFSD
ncbi:MAG: hypothetical protein EXR34_13785 [Rhodoferax sp.]|nr:hypothetical protein [Rhodoferax sp.]